MHNTALIFCFGEGGNNCFRKPREPREPVQNGQSIFAALIFTDFKGEYFLVAILMDAEHDIGS
jgi:hypothetical protein